MDGERTYPFADLAEAPLVVDAIYEGGTAGTSADDPIHRLVRGVGNQGGFRSQGSPWQGSTTLVVLYTSSLEPDWPDNLDRLTGIFTYFGDNRKPGRDLHETQRGGNILLRDVFAHAHGNGEARRRVPPFLLFEKAGKGRDVRFAGLLAPGAATLTSDDDLVAIWRSTRGTRFQNYRAQFTVLDVPTVTRDWLNDVYDENSLGSARCPAAWSHWVESGTYTPLVAPATTIVRGKAEQLPDRRGHELLAVIRDHYRGHQHDFEFCAIELWRLLAPATGRCDATQPRRDGGRDATGEYVLGPPSDPITIDFALEAKCYSGDNSVGVREVARLISRLRHRQFGVFVTTSYFNRQVYDEIRTDHHPIALVAGGDIVEALRSHGITDTDAVRAWLNGLSRHPSN